MTMVLTATRTRATVRDVRIALPPPHSPGQRELVETPLSVVLLGGGRYGKTEAEVRRIIRAMAGEPDLYFWVGLSWQSASMAKAWRMLYHHWAKALNGAGLDPRRWINRSRHEISLPNGALLMLRTAEAPESIAGDGPRGIVGDEFPYWREEVWTRFIQPSLADHDAWCHLIGRPNGANWGYDLWQSAAGRPGWLQRRYTIEDNPLIARSVIADLRANTPAPIWDQEYMAVPESGGDGVIPRAWVEQAQARWRAMSEADRERGAYVLAVDVSEGGGDLTTFAHRFGWTIARVTDETPRRPGDMIPIGDKLVAALGRHGGYAIVDSVGVGAMLPGYARRHGARCFGFKAGLSTKLRDATGEQGFADLSAAAWWNLRELLNPDTGPGVAIPDDPRLTAELTSRRYEIRAGSKIGLEKKDAVRKRLGRSPDRADAVVMAFWDKTVLKTRSMADGE